MKLNRLFYFFFWLLLGILVGTLLGNLCAGIPWLSWLAFSQAISVRPAFDLAVISMDMALSMSLNLAQAVCIALALFIYGRYWR